MLQTNRAAVGPPDPLGILVQPRLGQPRVRHRAGARLFQPRL